MKLLKERFDTLSDAIIAIIMTILVLEIQIPSSIEQLPQLAESVGLFPRQLYHCDKLLVP